MPHDEHENALDKLGIGSSPEKIAMMRDIVKPLAETFRSIEALGVMEAFREMAERHKAVMATFPLQLEARRIAVSAAAAVRSIEGMGMASAIREMEERNKLLFASFQPHIDAMAGADRLFRDSPVFNAAQQAAEMLKKFEARFRLPVLEEWAGLAASFAKSPAIEALSALSRKNLDIEAAMGMRSAAWLDAANAMRSVGAVAELQSIGKALATMPAFDDTLAGGLRASLGDWRDQIEWPREVFSSVVARAELYESLGFNTALTDFPDEAFEEGLDTSGVRRERPPLLVIYEPPVPRADNEADEDDFARTNQAHDWLQRLESQLRSFIDARMTALFGQDWVRHRLPNGMYDRWLDKQKKAQHAGAPVRPVIAYADFTDYEPLICKRDNWGELFGAFFMRTDSVRESFQRLYPIRLDTMHARIVTHDDVLLLYVEARRLMKMIGGE